MKISLSISANQKEILLIKLTKHKTINCLLSVQKKKQSLPHKGKEPPFILASSWWTCPVIFGVRAHSWDCS